MAESDNDFRIRFATIVCGMSVDGVSALSSQCGGIAQPREKGGTMSEEKNFSEPESKGSDSVEQVALEHARWIVDGLWQRWRFQHTKSRTLLTVVVALIGGLLVTARAMYSDLGWSVWVTIVIIVLPWVLSGYFLLRSLKVVELEDEANRFVETWNLYYQRDCQDSEDDFRKWLVTTLTGADEEPNSVILSLREDAHRRAEDYERAQRWFYGGVLWVPAVVVVFWSGRLSS